jgi:cysteine synthase
MTLQPQQALIMFGAMIIMTPMLAFSQVEEQEGNAMGKLQKLQEVMEKCEQVVTLDYMEDDCHIRHHTRIN